MPLRRHHPDCPSSFPVLAPLTDTSPAACDGVQWRPLLCSTIAFVLLILGQVANAQLITGEPPSADGRRSSCGVRCRSRPAVWDSRDLDTTVMRAESFGEVRAVSPKGAMGLTHIMPETWARLRVGYGRCRAL